jgi:choline dehydrogenase
MHKPAYADTIVIGGGTAGAAVAGRLAARGDQSVVLIEAGPDYGALADGQWPPDLLAGRVVAATHDWGYTSAAQSGQANHPLQRARVIGGCSSHNGCISLWGHRADYDSWARLAGPEWSTDNVLPFFHTAAHSLRARPFKPTEITPFHRACLEAMVQVGAPLVDDLNNLDEDIGVSTAPVNIHHDLRWNTALAYLDPVRGHSKLTVLGDVLVDKVRVTNGRATAVDVIRSTGSGTIEAGRIVICAGAYGSPAILLRSGIGPADDLRRLGINPVLNLPGVGRNLHDHPAIYLRYRGTKQLTDQMDAFVANGNTLFTEQSLAKLRSAYCDAAFDLHIYPVTAAAPDQNGLWDCTLPVANMTPRSRGRLQLRRREPDASPIINTGYLSDPDDADLAVLMSGIEIARHLAKQQPLADLIGEELPESAALLSRETARRACLHYYHPVGTCKMGPGSDPMAVVDARGQIHGLDNLYVADAAIMPVIPRANTNLPTLMVAERIVTWLGT